MSTNRLKKFASFRHPRENIRNEKNGNANINKGSIWRTKEVRRKSLSTTEPPPVSGPDDNNGNIHSTKSDFQRTRKVINFQDVKLKFSAGAAEKRKSASSSHIDMCAASEPSNNAGNYNPALFLSEGNLAAAASVVEELKTRLALRSKDRGRGRRGSRASFRLTARTPPVHCRSAAISRKQQSLAAYREMAVSASVLDWLTEVRYRTDDGLECLMARPPCSAPVQVSAVVPTRHHSEESSPSPDGVTLRPRSSQQLRADCVGRARTCFLYPPGGRVNPTVGGSIVKQGPLERVKVGGPRRLPRHWDRQRFACLTGDGRLFMSEDAAAAVETAQDPVAAAKRLDDVVVDTIYIAAARVVRGSTFSSKKNVIEITESEGRKTLIQNDEAVTSDTWFEVLSKAAAGPRVLRSGSLPRSAGGERPAVETVGGAQGTQAAAHDASVRSALGRFFSGNRRPTRESLETRGIYRDEPVFGSRLCALGGEVPFFVRECTRVLGAEPHVLQPGLYRISGNLSRIQRLRLCIDQNATSENEQRRAIKLEQDTDVLAGALKLFFRELRDPLLPYGAYTKLLASIEHSHGRPEEARLKTMRQSLRDEKLISESHLAALALLCRHLAHVCSYERHNQMTTSSMAIVWGPSFTWPANANQDALLQCTHVNRVVDFLISHEKRLFD